MNYKFIEEKPDFIALCELRNRVKQVENLIILLAEDDDTLQRVTDLYECAKLLLDEVKEVVIEEA